VAVGECTVMVQQPSAFGSVAGNMGVAQRAYALVGDAGQTIQLIDGSCRPEHTERSA